MEQLAGLRFRSATIILMAQGFDPIFEGIGDALEAFALAFALLFALAALAAFVGKVHVSVVGAASAISLLVHVVVTAKRLARGQYRAKGPGLSSPLLTLPGILWPAMALVVMLKSGVGLEAALVFLLSMAVLLFVWFAPWAQHVRALSQEHNVSFAVGLGQVIGGNKARFLLTIGVPLLLVIWVSAATIRSSS